jgi:hypothetical protein
MVGEPHFLPNDIFGTILLYVYDGKTLPSLLLTCRAWSSPPSWVKSEMRFKKCLLISPSDPWTLALRLAYFDVFHLLFERKFTGCNSRVLDQAAKSGLLAQLIWLLEHTDERCSTDALDLAAANGHLKVVIWLHKNSSVGCTSDAVDYAAINGHIDVVTFLLENRTEGFTSNALKGAARRPKIVSLLQKYKNLLR